jgi:hypothetical protein
MATGFSGCGGKLCEIRYPRQCRWLGEQELKQQGGACLRLVTAEMAVLSQEADLPFIVFAFRLR